MGEWVRWGFTPWRGVKYTEHLPVLFMRPLIPLIWTSGNVSSGFQSQSGQPYLHLTEAYMLHVLWDLPLGGWHVSQAVPFHMPARRHMGVETGIYRVTTASQCETRQTLYRLSYDGLAKLLDLSGILHNPSLAASCFTHSAFPPTTFH